MFSAKRFVGVTSIVAATSILLVASFFNKNPETAQAGSLTNLSVSVEDKTKLASTKYTFTLTNATKIPKDGGRIHIQVNGPGWDMDFSYATLDSAASTSGLAIYGRGNNNLSLSTSSDIAANSTITAVLNQVKNPSRGGYYFAQIWTAQYYTNLDGTSNWGGDYRTAYWEIGTNTNVTGTITDSDGNPVPFAAVSMNDSNWSNSYYTYADKNGKYGFGDVIAGTLSFRVNSPPTYDTGKVYYPPTDTSITVAASGVTTKNASFLATPKTITGKITKDTASGTTVTDANVSIYRMGGSGWAQASTDSNGNFSFTVPGGTWSISVYPKNYPADWATPSNSYGSETITFADDTTSESKSKNFIVRSLSSEIKGKIKKPNGDPVAMWGASINFNGTTTYPDPSDTTKTKTDTYYFYASLNSTDGSFSTKVVPGTFSASGWGSDNTLSFPKINNFTVGENKIYDMGIITLSEKTDVITGVIKDNFGAVVAGASVSAYKNDNNNYDYGYTTTASDGTYSIKVVPGTWQVSAYPQWKEGGSDYVYSGKPQSVTVTSGVPATLNFTFQKTTATIKILVTDPDGNTLSTLYSWANASDGSWGNIGTSITNGVGTLKVPAGKWTVNVNLYGGDWGSPESQVVEVADYATKSITMKALSNNSKIIGTIKDDKGNKITNKWISIYASKGKGNSWQSAVVDQANATYEIKVSEGTWNVGWWIDQSLGYFSDNSGAEVTVKANATATYGIILKVANATMKGRATKSDGTAMQWAWISATTQDPEQKSSASSYYFSNGASTNSNGDYTLKVPAGTYWVRGNMWYGSGYINPKYQKVTVKENEEATADLVFRSADGKISGSLLQAGTGVQGYVKAYSEDGGFAEANSTNSGNYELIVSSGAKWHLSASRQDGKKVYKTEKEVLVDLTSTTTATQNLELKEQNFTLPDKKASSFKANQTTTIELNDSYDMEIVLPAGSVTKTNDDLNLTAEPTVELPAESGKQPVSNYGQEITITKTDGTEIENFAENSATIKATYSDQTNDKFNKSEVKLAYWDENSSTWKELTGCTTSNADVGTQTFEIVTATSVTITCPLSHVTLFALVAHVDTIAPSAPTEQKATASDTKVTLSWKNPTETDFASITIYRSTTLNTLGDAIKTGQTGTSYENTGLTNGTTYYYTIRAVDQSGNASINTTQVSATPSAQAASSGSSSTSDTSSSISTLPKVGYDAAQATYEQSLALYGLLILGALMFWLELSRFRAR